MLAKADRPVEWYAGSALINAFALNAAPGAASLDLCEWLPETRRVLRCVLAETKLRTPMTVQPAEEQGQPFDGEVYVKEAVGNWGKQDLILLDPFAMWRQPEHQAQRDRYCDIVDGLIARGNEAPSLILFWTWGQNYPSADADLNGAAKPVKNGYSEQRAKLHIAGFHFVVVQWHCELQFAMWIVVPAADVSALKDDIDLHCGLLTDHLTRNGYTPSLDRPSVEID